jgi:L-fuculose-phosphate aldolase
MITAIGNVMRELHARNWITTRDGNASLRRKGSKSVYITPSGFRKTVIYPEHMVKMKVSPNGLIIPEGTNPSGELHMHWLILENTKKTRAVVHAHPTYTIAAMYRGFDLPTLCEQFPEIYRYTRVGPSVEAIPAITAELGEETARNLGVGSDGSIEYDIVGQMQHGVCAVAENPWDAFEHIERLEHICKITLASGVSPSTVADREPME